MLTILLKKFGTDIAVGAPYERDIGGRDEDDFGAIYIFVGSRTGLNPIPYQVGSI